MRSVFYPHLVNGPFGDPALYLRIAHRREALLFDCGSLHALSPRELLKVHSVFVSHGHIDHLIGFDHLLRTFLYLDRCLVLYGSAGMVDQVRQRLAGYSWNLIEGCRFVLTVREWSEGQLRECSFRAANCFRADSASCSQTVGDCLVETPDWRVRTVALDHGDIVSLAFALEETTHVAIHRDALVARGYLPGAWLTHFKRSVRRGAVDDERLEVPLVGGGSLSVPLGELRQGLAHCEPGMKVVYVTDAAPSEVNCQKIMMLAQEAHLLVIEAAFSEQERERAQQRHHLTAHLAGTLGRKAGARKLMVFHHSPRYRECPALLQREAMISFQDKADRRCSLK